MDKDFKFDFDDYTFHGWALLDLVIGAKSSVESVDLDSIIRFAPCCETLIFKF